MLNLIFRIRIFFKSLFVECKVCFDGDIYPIYGVAPHYHDFSDSGSYIGSTRIYENKLWPDNFVPEIEDGETIEQAKTGVYYCTNKNCVNHKNNRKRFNLKTYNGPEELQMTDKEISIEEVKIMGKFLYEIWDNEEEDNAWSDLDKSENIIQPPADDNTSADTNK